MNHKEEQTSRFAQSFFRYLEESGNPAVVLHGGADGFVGEISDIDFAVGHDAFSHLPKLIHDYCERSGWRLCQILRHETTAAYFVCSAVADPSLSVALDACSDYQRNGTLYLSAEELLENRRELAWGGYESNAAVMLRYRFAKAAAKKKDPHEVKIEFSIYPPEARAECSKWLKAKWGISLSSWEETALSLAFHGLRKRSNHRPPLFAGREWRRILKRIIEPTGMVVVTGEEHFKSASQLVKNVFGPLYFRRVVISQSFHLSHLKDLISSTLVIVPKISGMPASLLPKNIIHNCNSQTEATEVSINLAAALASRCLEREDLI